MKKVRGAFLPFLFSILIFAPRSFALDFPEYENSILQEVFRVRLEARKFSTNSESLEFVRNSRAKILSDSALEKISDEAKITFENFFVWEEFHFLWEENPEDSEAWKLLENQYEKNLRWKSSHPVESRNFWYSLGVYELANSFMPKMKLPDLMKVGLEEKKFYDSFLERDSENGVLCLNVALWYDYAPSFGGGSVSKAEKYLLAAVKNARTDYEKFFSNFYLSQLEFDRGESALCEKYFSAAQEILGESGFLKFTRGLNEAGFSYLEYTKNRGKVEKSLSRKK